MRFTRLFFGESSLDKTLLVAPEQLGVVYSGEEVVVTAIKVQHTKLI
jgi:hypothetical protein